MSFAFTEPFYHCPQISRFIVGVERATLQAGPAVYHTNIQFGPKLHWFSGFSPDNRADKIYRNRENLSYCKEHGIRLSGPALGRPKKGETRDKAQDYRDDCERVEVERRFSLAKRKCGMGLVTAKLRETAAHVIAMSVLVLNLRKIQCAFWELLTYLLAIFMPVEKWAIVQ